MALPLPIKIRSGYLVALLLLLTSYFLIFYAIRQLNGATRSVTESYEVINSLETIKTAIVSAETGVRGYAITKDSNFLAPYRRGAQSVMPVLNRIQILTSEDQSHQENLGTLESLLTTRLLELETILAAYDSSGFTTQASRIRREGSKETMDSIILLVTQMEEKEQTLILERQEKLREFFQGTQIITIASLLVTIITIIYSVMVFNRENRARAKADEKAGEFRNELEGKVKELNEMNTELQELRNIEKFAATGRIARTMAHEVRNPLTNISLATEQLKEITANNEESEILLQMISRNASRINQLVSDLLSATRFAQLNFQKVNLNNLMEETLDLAIDRIELKRIRVEKDYEQEACIIDADPEKLKVAILNIVVNALEAMEEDKGLLQLKTRKKGDKCIVEIRDNGIGMNEDTVHKMFDPYFTGKNKGNGLGLTNTQNTILNHKGNIKVTSKPGVGTTFVITLNITVEQTG